MCAHICCFHLFVKTISFLLPALQQLLHRERLTRDTIHMLVLSPTRELAVQIDNEAQKLTTTTNKNKQNGKIHHQVIFGGVSRSKDVTQFERHVPTILVATPGRLRDHLDNTLVKGKPFRNLFQKTSILVLDETDRYVTRQKSNFLFLESRVASRCTCPLFKTVYTFSLIYVQR